MPFELSQPPENVKILKEETQRFKSSSQMSDDRIDTTAGARTFHIKSPYLPITGMAYKQSF